MVEVVLEHERGTHLIETVSVEENPTKLDNLGRVLGHINAVLVAGCRDMDNHVTVDLERGRLLGSHGCSGQR
jgi:hypothetical protein